MPKLAQQIGRRHVEPDSASEQMLRFRWLRLGSASEVIVQRGLKAIARANVIADARYPP